MNFDTPTLFAVLIITSLAVAITLAVVALGRKVPGLWYLTGSTLCVAPAYLLYALRGQVPGVFSISLPNALVALSSGLLLMAIGRLRGIPVHRALVYLPPVVVFIATLLLQEHPQARLATVNALLLAYRAPALYLLLARGGIGIGHGRHILLASVLGTMVLFAIRSGLVALGMASTQPLLSGAPLSITTYVVAYLSLVLTAMGFVLAAAEMAGERSRQLASTDSLTGLPNRRAMLEMLEQHWKAAVARQGPLALMMIDVDHFKLINDQHGHPGGDVVIQRVGELLRSELRPPAVAGRFGGEEFMVILPITPPQGATALAEALRETLAAQRIDVLGSTVRITASIGVHGLWPKPADSIPELVRRADAAMYRAKAAGRNQVAAA